MRWPVPLLACAEAPQARPTPLAAVAAVAVALTGASPPPELIIFGGGWGPEGTQASLESQVIALEKALKARSPTVLFAAGTPTARAVQIAAPVDPVAELLGLIFNDRRNLHTDYRPAKVRAAGPANRSRLIGALRAHRTAEGGTIVFGVGHGSPADDRATVALELWGPDDRLTVEALAKALDPPRKGPTAFVLGQCHSGAFTAVAYRDGRSDRPLASPARCTFAAAPADREASGCTTDLSSPSALAYASQMTVAMGAARTSADADRDGRVSLSEAHAFARIHDPTIDVPVSTSEAWMESTLGDRAPNPERLDLRKLVDAARPSEQSVLRALGPAYVLNANGFVAARNDFDRLQDQIEAERNDFDELQARFDDLRKRLLDRVLARWPELANPYHPVSRALLAGPAPAVIALLRAQAELPELRRLDTELIELDARLLRLDKQTARLERWLRAAQATANERAIVASGGPRARALASILACESLVP